MERISLAEQQRSMALKEENNVNYSPGSTVVCRLQLHLSASSQWIDRSVRAANLIRNVWRGDGVKRREGIRFHGSDPIRWLGTRERNVGRARPVGATPRRAHRSACPRRASPGASSAPARRTAAGARHPMPWQRGGGRSSPEPHSQGISFPHRR